VRGCRCVAANASPRWSRGLRVDRLAPGQHLHELFDASGSGLDPLCVSDPIQNGVPIRTGQCLEYCLGLRVGLQGIRQIVWHFHPGLPGVGGRPPTVCLCFLDFGFARWMHSAGGTQSLRNGDIPLRPRAAGVSRGESSLERDVVTTPELPIDPAEANRFVECTVVEERRRMRRTVLGEYEPDTL
jgi:hypothetical protein